jgi:hypothetical protein
MSDRRRINGPVAATFPPVFLDDVVEEQKATRLIRSRPSDALRKLCEFDIYSAMLWQSQFLTYL